MPVSDPSRTTVRFPDRLLAEAVRAAEDDGRRPFIDPGADERAIAAGGDLEHRVVARAASLGASAALLESLERGRHVVRWTVAVALVFATLAGVTAARGALGSGESHPVNVFFVLAGLFGFQSILLLLWMALMLLRPRSSSVTPLGEVVRAAAHWLSGRAGRGREGTAALRATATAHARGPMARSALSAISHSMWSMINLGAIGMLIVLLSTRHYTFNWETTILSRDAYVTLTSALARPLQAIGLETPTRDEIVGSERGGDEALQEDARGRWSSFLVGALAVYGLAPRLFFLLASLLGLARARGRYRLDLAAPGFARLQNRLMPGSSDRRTIDPETGMPPRAWHRDASSESGREPAAGGSGAAAILGVEVDPATGWPPAIASGLGTGGLTDLGIVDGREDRTHAMQTLAALEPAPRRVIAVCELTTTPDRGLGAFLARLVDTSPAPVGIVLSGGEAMRSRSAPADVAQRVSDWRELASEAGIDGTFVEEIDLAHLTDVTRVRLASLAGVAATAAAGGRRLEQAFGIIARSAHEWTQIPDLKAQTALHEDIARLYEHEARGLARWLRWPDDMVNMGNVSSIGDMGRELRSGAGRMADLLPPRLKASPQWMAAGAIAGAAGCVAIGTFLAPAAFAAIPAWSIGGAGLGGLARWMTGGGDDQPSGEEVEIGDAVRGAALFAVLLELQGNSEATITRLLDRTFDDTPPPATAAACAEWLRETRHRLDLARVEEQRA